MEIKELRAGHSLPFIYEIEDAFQKGYEAYYGKTDDPIITDDEIESSLDEEGSVALEIIENNERLGGAIVVISKDGSKGDLHILYTKVGEQNKGVASRLWKEIENMYPDVEVWETCTPYFDIRNIHFYINKCGFHAVEFINDHHPGNDIPGLGDNADPAPGGMFRFIKTMRDLS